MAQAAQTLAERKSTSGRDWGPEKVREKSFGKQKSFGSQRETTESDRR
jgi:hypothetical protein